MCSRISHPDRTWSSRTTQFTDLSRNPYGFDSHHPLHSRTTSGKLRQQPPPQFSDCLGDSVGTGPPRKPRSLPWIASECPSFRTEIRTWGRSWSFGSELDPARIALSTPSNDNQLGGVSVVGQMRSLERRDRIPRSGRSANSARPSRPLMPHSAYGKDS